MDFYDAFIDELEKIAGIGGLPAGTWSPAERARGTAADTLKMIRKKSPRRAREFLAKKKGQQIGKNINSDMGDIAESVQRMRSHKEAWQGASTPKKLPSIPGVTELGGKVHGDLQRQVEIQRRMAHRRGERMTPSMTRSVQKGYEKAYSRGMSTGEMASS